MYRGKPSKPYDIIDELERIKQCLCNAGIDCKPAATILPKLVTLSPTPPPRQVITSTDSGGVSWQDIKYTRTFEAGEWVGVNLTVLASVHGKGPCPMIQVFKGDVTVGFEEAFCTTINHLLIKIDAGGAGNITLTLLGGYPAFNGKIIII